MKEFPKWTVVTEHPVALDSPDHLHPHGTANDDTHSIPFVQACEREFGSPLRYMDIGCSGGGIVEDFLSRGHEAVGLEGSDYSGRHNRASWPRIPGNLFTCDVRYPFQVLRDGEPAKFDVISGWAFLEHIDEDKLPCLFQLVRDHLVAAGLFIGSISEAYDGPWHVTRKPREWWSEKMEEHGFTSMHRYRNHFQPHEFARTDGFGPNGHGWPFVVVKRG